ncbi:hypothetical protein EW145_g2458 [Phellinidium pouzarii]|uniref:Diphthamide biosynthesis protein 4 n=1 Tax=Phellinidium pouzarii TaxID=167371 RepID=A0A4S4LCR1_9AGAM|nr:hypothetical protein EW145_g2458 [Phellinidium pouzarii]
MSMGTDSMYSCETLYNVLHIPASATRADIKSAYHRALLLSHPDKRKRVDRCTENTGCADGFDIARIQDAYRTLIDRDARAAYDASLASSTRSSLSISSNSLTGPRPAQVVSLEEFVYNDTDNVTNTTWSYACRCGGLYVIGEIDMENDRHVIACEQCSETIYVGYEAVEDAEDES